MDYMFVDADNHYYEAEDAFLRYADEDVKRYVRWVSEGKRRYMVFGSTMIGVANTGVPNPTFNPIAAPGAFHLRLKQLQERTSGVTGIQLDDVTARTASWSSCPTATASTTRASTCSTSRTSRGACCSRRSATASKA